MGTFTLTQIYFLWKKLVLLLRYCEQRFRYFILMQYKLKMLQFIPSTTSTVLWAVSDAHSRMIHSFESILFKGLIKAVGKPVSRFGSWISLNDSFSSLLRVRVIWSASHSESLRTSRALFQEECLCLDTINIDIFTIFTLTEI